MAVGAALMLSPELDASPPSLTIGCGCSMAFPKGEKITLDDGEDSIVNAFESEFGV